MIPMTRSELDAYERREAMYGLQDRVSMNIPGGLAPLPVSASYDPTLPTWMLLGRPDLAAAPIVKPARKRRTAAKPKAKQRRKSA